ncbi:MAG: 16S rRNA (cytosine(1402)-N(4))-methyltransferase RsmH [Planctomycetaceae bacterium]|nr:16S rRNA (cytosine(1402)-N(4))-methyltransferase RsmH [Planctomycetaceae bacterium]
MNDDGNQKPPRRVRYRGTHPRRFEQRYKELSGDAATHEHVRAAGRTPAGTHVPIMVAQSMQSLAPAAGEIVIDCTLGYGGHAMEFARRIGPGGRLIGLDVDAAQLQRTRERLAGLQTPLSLHCMNFAGVGKVLALEGIEGADIIFADLGVSSMQLDDPARGFSYKHDGPLDMRMSERLKATAADWLMRLSEEDISDALRDLGDEADHQRIAALIVQRRAASPLTRTGELAELVLEAKGLDRRAWRQETSSKRPPHPAAQTFQTLRMLVNDELGCLRELLRAAPYCLRAGGRMGILTFHSGEDRLVKHAFKEGLATDLYSQISDEVIRPTPAEVNSNPRSRPAKFRWAVKN